jgi:hypothetical protein
MWILLSKKTTSPTVRDISVALARLKNARVFKAPAADDPKPPPAHVAGREF